MPRLGDPRWHKYTTTSVAALCRRLRRLGVISKHPVAKPNYWRPGSLAKRLGVKRSTLSGWRRRGWVQAQQVGGRRMYWADEAEMKRLEQLAARDRTGFRSTPRELTTAVSQMPECRQARFRENDDNQEGIMNARSSGPSCTARMPCSTRRSAAPAWATSS